MKLTSHPAALPAWRRQTSRPALPNRVIHVDLKGPKIPFNVFKDLLKLYARWGINTVLVEYEHRLPELPLPRQFPKADRYSRREIETLTKLARDLGIQYIPLVQTLGHVEYLRRVPGTVRMMENPEYPNQLCPSNPTARDYVASLVDYVCDLHPDSKYLNVGLDETHQLGFCPICKKRAAKLGGSMELYLDHANWVTRMALDRGRTPMMAGDMFFGGGREDLLSRLDPRVIVMPWDYNCVRERAPYVLYKGGRPGKGAFRHDYSASRARQQLPIFAAEGRFADDLSAKQLQSLGGFDRKTGTAPAFSQARLIASRKRALWGYCAADASASGPFMPNFARGFHNCKQVVRSVLDLRGDGAVATCWARGHSFAPINSMWTLSLYGFAQFAASAWCGKTSPSDLEERSTEIAKELGLPARIGDWSLDDLLWILGNPTMSAAGGRAGTLQNVLTVLKNLKSSGAFIDGLRIAVEAEWRWQQLLFALEESRWWYPNRETVPPIMGNDLRKRLKQLLREIDRLKPIARKYYTNWVGESAAFETWWRGLFDVDRALAQRAAAMI